MSLARNRTVQRRARWDGEYLVPMESVYLPQGIELEVTITYPARTFAELRFGLPPVVLEGEGPSASEMIIEERRSGL